VIARRSSVARSGAQQGLLYPALLVGARNVFSLGLSLDVFLLDTQLADSLNLARNLPDTTIILNHTGGPWALVLMLEPRVLTANYPI
jgi:predicted TIM-barrel fold metal-dependent hydrolase